MPSVAELTALYTNFLLEPTPGPEVCTTCFNFTRGYELCYACSQIEHQLVAVLPISYSVAHGQLHYVLSRYKRFGGEVSRQLSIGLAAVLWRFISTHEACLAHRLHRAAPPRDAPAATFDLVTTVPSGDRARDPNHPLRRIVGSMVGPTREREEHLLERSPSAVEPRAFDPDKFTARRGLDGESVLLIDDTWTTGASAQSAAAALHRAGAGQVAAIVIGRHLNPEWHENRRRIEAIPPFDWGRCALCAADGSGETVGR